MYHIDIETGCATIAPCNKREENAARNLLDECHEMEGKWNLELT